MREEDENNNTDDTKYAAIVSGLAPTCAVTARVAIIGKKQKENKARIYKIETNDLLYFAKFIVG